MRLVIEHSKNKFGTIQFGSDLEFYPNGTLKSGKVHHSKDYNINFPEATITISFISFYNNGNIHEIEPVSSKVNTNYCSFSINKIIMNRNMKLKALSRFK